MRKSFATKVRKNVYESSEWMPLEEGIFTEARKRKAAVVGIGSSAGTTFTAANLAYIMAKSVDGVCFVEKEYGYLSGADTGTTRAIAGIRNEETNERFAYRSIPLDRVLPSKRAVDYFEAECSGLTYGNRRNLYANVNWVVHLPGENVCEQGGFRGSTQFGKGKADEGFGQSRENEAGERKFRYEAGVQGFALRGGDGLKQERIPGRYLILDEPPIARLTEAELVICVVDPLPSRLHSGMEKLVCLRENRIKAGRKFSPVLNLPTPVIWVLNKDNSRVSHRELEDFLKIRFDYVIPLLDERIFYHAEYSGVPIFKLLDSACQGRTGGTPVRDPAASAGSPLGKREAVAPADSLLGERDPAASAGSPLGKRGAACGSAALRGLWGQPSVPPEAAQAARAELERLAKHILNELHYTI